MAKTHRSGRHIVDSDGVVLGNIPQDYDPYEDVDQEVNEVDKRLVDPSIRTVGLPVPPRPLKHWEQLPQIMRERGVDGVLEYGKQVTAYTAANRKPLGDFAGSIVTAIGGMLHTIDKFRSKTLKDEDGEPRLMPGYDHLLLAISSVKRIDGEEQFKEPVILETSARQPMEFFEMVVVPAFGPGTWKRPEGGYLEIQLKVVKNGNAIYIQLL